MNKEVEKKIIEMTFDNTQFESGVKQTMSTIDALKEKLKFKGFGDGVENLQSAFNGLSMRGAIDGLDNFTVRMNALSIVAHTIIESITKDVYHLVGKLTSGIDSVINQIKTGGETRALNIEQAKFQLQGLGVAWDEIKDDINYAVKDTAYGLDAAAKAASQLVASNVKLGEEMRFSLRGISGLAAMTNSSYEDISRIFTKVAGQGRLMGDDLNSVAARGINVAAELGKVFNVTEADIRDMVSKGAIDFKTFAKAMDDAFGQHAKDANKTYTGSLSNVKAALNRLGADIATTKFEGLRDIFNELIPKIDEFKTRFKPAEEAIKNFMKMSSDHIKNLIKELDVGRISSAFSNLVEKTVNTLTYLKEQFNDIFGSLVSSITNFTSTIFKSTDLTNVMDKVSGVLSSITSAIAHVVEQFERAVKVIVRTSEIDAFKKLEDDAKSASNAIDKVKESIDGVADSNEENADKNRENNKELQAAKDIVNGLYGELNGQKRIDYIKDVLKLDPDVVQDYINQVYDGGKKWDEVVLQAGDNAEKSSKKYEKLSETIKNIVKTFKSFAHVVKNIFESVTNVASVMVDSFRNAFDLNTDNMFSNLPSTLTEISDEFKITEERAENLRPVFDTIFSILNSVIKAFKSLIGYIKNFIDWVRNNETLQKVISDVRELFGTIFKNLIKLKDDIVNSDAFKNIVNALKPVVGEIGNFISFVIAGVTSIITRLSNMITQVLDGRSLFDAISEFLVGTVEKRTTLYGILKGGFVVGLIGLIAKAIFKMKMLSNDGIFYIFKFLGVLSNLSRVLFTYKYYLRANAFTAIAKGIGILVLSVVGLAYYINNYGVSSIVQAAVIIAGMVAGMLAIMHSISRIETAQMGFGGFIKASIVIRSMGLSIAAIAGALYFVASAINDFGLDSVFGGLGVIVVALTSLVGAMFVLSKMNTSLTTQTVSSTKTTKSLERVGAVLLAMSVSMLIISKAISSLLRVCAENNISGDELLEKGIFPIVILLTVVTTAMAVLQSVTTKDVGKTSLIKVASVLLGLSIGISIISKALTSLVVATAGMSVGEVWKKGILPIIALMGAMIAGIALLSLKSTSLNNVTEQAGKKNKLKSSSLQRVASVILGMSIGIFIITKSLVSLLKVVSENNISTEEIWTNGLLPIITLLGVIFGGIIVFGKIVDSKSSFFTPGKYASLALVIVGIAGSISLILISLSLLLKTMKKNNISSGQMWNAVLATIAIFAAIIGGFILIATMVKGLKLLAVSAGLLIITTTMVAAMAALGLVTTVFDMKKIFLGIGAVAALIGVITLIGGLAGTAAAGGMIALAGGLLSIGASLIVLAAAVGVADIALFGLGIALPVLATGIKDTVLILVDGILKIINEIPVLAEALANALGSLAYTVGKMTPLIVSSVIHGLVDGIKEALDINSPSGVFMEIGGNCVAGLLLGFLNGLEKFADWIVGVIDTYIVQPFCDFFGIHSPSTLMEGYGGDMVDGLSLGIQNGLSDIDTEGFASDFSSLVPDLNSMGFDAGTDFTSGLDEGLDITSLGDKLGGDFSSAIVDGAETEGRKLDWTKIYHLEDLINDSSIYDYLKSVGEEQLTAAYEDWQRHSEFMANNPTYKAYLDNIETNFGPEFAEKYREIQATGNDAMKAELDKYLLGMYIDQTKLDESTFALMNQVKDSIDASTGKIFSDRKYNNIAQYVTEQLKEKDAIEDAARAERNEKRMKLIMSVEDDQGNILTNGVQSLFKNGTSYLNVDYDNSSVKSNMDAVSADMSSVINAQGDKITQKLEFINNRVNEFDTNQMNRTNSLLSRISQMEDAISQIQVRLDTGALVGQLVDPLDEAFGAKSRRKGRG